jgi:hypothetical protein
MQRAKNRKYHKCGRKPVGKEFYSLAFGALLPVTTLLCALCLSAEAQQPKKVPRIGYLASRDAATESTRSEPVRLALKHLGYIEGENIQVEYRDAEGKRDRYPELLADLVRLKVDVIVAAGGNQRSGRL